MSQWKDQLRELATLDSKHRIFGVSGNVKGWGHRYEPQLVTESQLAAFESWCKGRLPDDYRRYVLTIGAGPGPYYGIMPFQQVRDELKIIYEDHAQELGTTGYPGDAFELEAELTKLISSGIDQGTEFAAPRSPGGFMPICAQGCEFLTVMVTSGSLAGRVFTATNFATVGSMWVTAGRPPGLIGNCKPISRLPTFPRSPTFAQWIDGWFEQCFADLRGDHGGDAHATLPTPSPAR